MIIRNLSTVFILFAMLFLMSCNDSGSTEIRVISPEEVNDAVYGGEPQQLVDVRTLEEFNNGHLANAQNICVTDDDFQKKLVDLDKNKPVYLYCRSGKRSAKAAKLMKELGFKEIYDMEGGYTSWEEHGFETEK